MSHRKQLLSLRLLILLIAVGAVFLLLSGRVAASTPAAEPVSYTVRAGDPSGPWPDPDRTRARMCG